MALFTKAQKYFTNWKQEKIKDRQTQEYELRTLVSKLEQAGLESDQWVWLLKYGGVVSSGWWQRWWQKSPKFQGLDFVMDVRWMESVHQRRRAGRWCCIRSVRSRGAILWRAFWVRSRTLKWIRCWMGSQWSCCKTRRMWSLEWALVRSNGKVLIIVQLLLVIRGESIEKAIGAVGSGGN